MKQLSQIIKRFSFLNFARVIVGFSIIMASLQLSETNVYGQSELDFAGIDSTFTPQLERNGSVSRVIFQPDGKRIFIGGFNKANGVERKNVVRVNPDNSIDTSFNFPENVRVESLELLPNGKFIAASPIAFNAAVLVRLNSDGSIDSGFNLGRTLTVTEIKFKPRGDGKVFAFGKFQVKKQSRVLFEDFMLLDEIGGIESGFKLDYTGLITDVIPLPDGKTIVCGSFEMRRFGQAVSRNLAVLDANGLPSGNFDIFFGSQNESVAGASFQPDGKLLVYGNFSRTIKQSGLGGSISKNKGITRLNADGSFDRTFSVPFAAASINQTFIQPDGKIILRGGINGWIYDGIYRIFPDGSADPTFNANTPFTANYAHRIAEIKIQPDGGILVAGQMKVVSRQSVQTLIRLKPDGALDEAYQPEVAGGELSGMENQPDGKVLIWGFFGRVGSRTRLGVARLNASGVPDESFRFDVVYTGSARVRALAMQTDGKIIIAGNFSVVNGEFIYHPEPVFSPIESSAPFITMVRLNQDGSLDNSFAQHSNTFEEIRSIAVQPDGKILLGGRIRDWLAPNYLVRLNPDGTNDSTFNRLPITSGFYIYYVSEIILQPDGKILLGGYFNRIGNINRYRIARLNSDGLVDESFNNDIYSNTSDFVEKFALQPDGKIIGGGEDGEGLGSLFKPGMPRFNPDGTLDANFKWNLDRVTTFMRDVKLQPDGKILFSGEIGFSNYKIYHPNGLYRMNQNGEIETRFNGVAPDKIMLQADGKIIAGYLHTVRLFPDGSVDNTFDFNFDFSPEIYVQQPDGKILVAGGFTTVNGIRQNGLVRLNP